MGSVWEVAVGSEGWYSAHAEAEVFAVVDTGRGHALQGRLAFNNPFTKLLSPPEVNATAHKIV